MTSPTTTTREEALNSIRQEVERSGKPTPLALRIRLANDISLADYRQAIQDGMKRWDTARQNGVIS